MDFLPDDCDKRKIEQPKVILAEGKDADHFLRHACAFYRLQQDIQVFNFGGIDQLTPFLNGFLIYTGFDKVDTILIARDAEENASAAFESVLSSLKAAKQEKLGLSIPAKPFEYFEHPATKRRCAIIIFPGPQDKAGTLEDLCLKTVENDPAMTCVESYLKCVQDAGEMLPRLHKNRLHTFLSGKDSVVGKPIGQAFQAKLFNPDHPSLEPFKRIIQQM
jgi:hypothetical protein